MRRWQALAVMSVAAAVLAACTTGTPKRTVGPSTARSSPAPSSTTRAPVASGSSRSALPPSSPSERSSTSGGVTTTKEEPVLVYRCPTAYGYTATAPAPLPSSATVAVPGALAGHVAVYADAQDLTRILGPTGWTCAALDAADGSDAVALYAPGEAVPTGNQATDPPQSDQAITVSQTGGSPVQAAAEACPYFSAAATSTERAFGHRCSALPAAVQLVRLASDAVAFEDPPGVRGTTDPSGGPYPANGVVIYRATQTPGTLQATCTLPQSQHDLCTAVLNAVLSRYGGTSPSTPGSS